MDQSQKEEVKRLLGKKWKHRDIRDKTGVSLGSISNIRNNRDNKSLNNCNKTGQRNNDYISIDGERRILVIGDLHEPFTRKKYLEFCKSIYDKYNCNEVIFIGDIIDNHYSSFYETDPDGHSAAKELKIAKDNVKKWYKTFPKAKVCIGNHDLIPARKLFSSGISKTWMRTIGEVLSTPNWEYAEEFIIDNVMYTHGTGKKARSRMVYDLISIVQGHYHSESYINYSVGKFRKMFAMQVGCGVNDKSYAMAYGRHFNKMHINCGVVLENGQLPILEYMKLGHTQ